MTVLMPVYNGEPYLASAVESILGQSFADFEFLIIDDGSTDRSCEIVRGYADPRIRLLRNSSNRGVIATLNRGLEEAHGEYLARMDADDISLPDRLAQQVAFLDAHPEVGVLGSAIELMDAQGAPGILVRFPASHNLIRWALAFYSPIAHPSAMMRTEIAASLGGYRSEARHCEDYDLWWRATRVTALANLETVLLRVRKHDVNVTSRFGAVQHDTALRICRSILAETLGEEFPLEVIAAAREHARAAEALIPPAIELIVRYHRYCLGAAAALGLGEAAVMREDLTKRVYQLVNGPDRGPLDAPGQRLRSIRRYAALACTDFLTAAETRHFRGDAAKRAWQVLKDTVRTRILARSGASPA